MKSTANRRCDATRQFIIAVRRQLLSCDVSTRPSPVRRHLYVHVVRVFQSSSVPLSDRFPPAAVAQHGSQQALCRRHGVRATTSQWRAVWRTWQLPSGVPDVRQQGRHSRVAQGDDEALRRRHGRVHRTWRHVRDRGATGRSVEPTNDCFRKSTLNWTRMNLINTLVAKELNRWIWELWRNNINKNSNEIMIIGDADSVPHPGLENGFENLGFKVLAKLKTIKSANFSW